MTFGLDTFIAGFDRGNTTQIDETSAFLIEVDAYLSETHDFESKIPEHPVESGSVVSDHIILLPPIVNIAGIITDTPLIKWNQTTGLLTPEEGRSQAKIKQLLEMRDAKQLFSINTSLGVYNDYFFTRLTPQYSVQDGYSVKFTATLKKFNLVTFRFGQRVLNQTQEVSARAAETNEVGVTTPQTTLVQIGSALF